ncbi:efflux RND transporter periplasmic adaptor subunit [Flavobacterium sp.]|uniref:efflux RND transporter periplasmic adaptor subunit n=1 Tax=Flavobacterium sp. TaxID=239 RepID=UPI003527A2AC
MKKNIIAILTLVLLVACGGDKKNSTESVIEKGDVKALREKRSQLVAQTDALNKEIELIDAAIGKLDTNHKIMLITTLTAKDTLFNHYLELQADVQTKENIILNSQFGGTLQQIYVAEGQRVTKGQTIAKVDDGGLSQQVAQLEIQAGLAKTTFERQQNLWNQKIGSEIQYLQAKSAYEAQAKAVNQLKSQLAKTVIKAPFSGTIDEIITDQGSVVAPGTPIARIINLSNMYLEAEVPEKYISSIKNGCDVMVELPTIGEKFNTKVSQTSNYINPANRSFMVQVKVPNKNGNIKPNLSAKVQIKDYSNPSVISVPASIISENAEGEQYVYIADNVTTDGNTVAKRVIVTTGLTQNGMIEILSGVTDGQHIIKEGARSVKDGQKVSIIK